MLKLNTPVTDIITGITGRLTHFEIEIGGARRYAFKPDGLNPEKGLPIRGKWFPKERIAGAIEVPDADLPVNALFTEATDTGSGFTGTVIFICLHINGCVHATLQPKGKDPKSNGHFENCDFDVRDLKGAAFPQQDEAALAESRLRKPSPAPMPDREASPA